MCKPLRNDKILELSSWKYFVYDTWNMAQTVEFTV